MENFCQKVAALHGSLGVAFGAFGAHSLKAQVASLPPEEAQKILGWVQTGSQYQLLHAAALLGLAALAPRLPQKTVRLTEVSWALGAAIFAGTLYAMALGAPRWLGAVTPLGGIGLMAGWVSLGLARAER